MRWDRITRNPADGADPPRVSGEASREMKTWDAGQLAPFLASTRGDRLQGLWHLLAMTGMRRGEALGLRWEDVDLEAGRISVRRALIPNGKVVVVSEPKTAQGRRVVALDPETALVLRAQAARQADEQQRQGEKWTDTGLVFTKEDGRAIHPEVASRFFRQAVKRAMLSEVRQHDLRHTHATLALRPAFIPRSSPGTLGMPPCRSPSTPKATPSRPCRRRRRRSRS